MNNILLHISSLLIIGSFTLYFIFIILGNKKVTEENGFDITKDIISEYNSINIIESKSYFTIYNIKRKVIKLSTRCYYGNTISDISLSLIEAGISVVDSFKNKYIDIFRKIFSNLKILYIFPLVSLIINYSTYNISDAKVSLVFIILFTVVSYILIDIKSQACMWISDNIKKIKNINNNNFNKIINYINRLILLDKLIFFSELIMIIRCIAIMLEVI